MTWKAYIQINALDTSNYFIENFEVSDYQYDILETAVLDNIPIKSLGIYDEVYKLAERAADYDAVIDKWPGVSTIDECTLADVIVDDPGDLKRFKELFIGKPLAEDALFELQEDYNRFVYYTVEISTERGVISDLNVSTSAIEMFSFRRNYDSDDAYPDYDFLTDELCRLLNYE